MNNEKTEKEILVEKIEFFLNDAVDQGMKNEDLKKILSQVIADIDSGFVGEPA